MAHPQTASGPVKVSSYAKIAALPAPKQPPLNSNPRNDSNAARSLSAENPRQTPNDERIALNDKDLYQRLPSAAIESIPIPLQKLELNDAAGDPTNSEPNADSADSYEEDQSQVSSSSLNKPQSFDTKSLASVTTFAMDDKESIRPDDSASVRAADDEHPHLSLSRNSSFQHEPESHSNRSSRVFPSHAVPSSRRFPTLATLPRFGNLPISPVLESQDVQMPQQSIEVISPDDPRDPSTVVVAPPDEKLMDALASAKDRLPLLQLEEKVLAFLASTTTVLELPPQNSFTRLLTHKLADYYSLPHAVNEDNTSVRIFRSGPRTTPTPLAQLAKSVPLGPSGMPAAAAVKIMRREQLGGRQFSAGNSTAPSSSAPSKATSENGVEVRSDDGLASPLDSTPSRDKSKMTREEREAQYKAARERIFADFQESVTSEPTSAGEQSATMSRSSSSSGRKKSRKNKPRDDSFEARSAFALTYAPTQSQFTNGYMDSSMINAYPVSPTYDQGMYGTTPTQSYSNFDTTVQYGHMQGFNPAMMQQASSNEWQAMQNMQMQEAYFMYQHALQFPHAQAIPGQMPDWYANQNQPYMNAMYGTPASPFQQQMPEQRFPMSADYGPQFQRTFAPPGLNDQYSAKANKSLFNPQTRSFIPNNSEGRPPNRATRNKHSTKHSLNGNSSIASSNASSTPSKEDSLKLRYGTPASLPKKPPMPSDSKKPDMTGPTQSEAQLSS